MPILTFAMIGIFLNAAITLSIFRRGCVGMRIMLTFGSTLSLAMSTAVTFGVCSIVGVLFTPSVLVGPLLLTAISWHPILVLVSKFDMTDELDDIEDRVMMTLKRGGSRVVMTALTITLLLAVVACAATFPGLRNFAAFASILVFCNCFFQVCVPGSSDCRTKRHSAPHFYCTADSVREGSAILTSSIIHIITCSRRLESTLCPCFFSTISNYFLFFYCNWNLGTLLSEFLHEYNLLPLPIKHLCNSTVSMKQCTLLMRCNEGLN